MREPQNVGEKKKKATTTTKAKTLSAAVWFVEWGAN
jgi:hypothetical protein